MRKMVMKTPEMDFEIELNDSETANAIWDQLPIEAYVNIWDHEIYFEIPVKMRLENGKIRMKVGEVAYWPQGRALCLFFGPTPVSSDSTPVAISPVSPVGMVKGDPGLLAKVGDRTKVRLVRA